MTSIIGLDANKTHTILINLLEAIHTANGALQEISQGTIFNCIRNARFV